ncbi:MAG: hypothetical protein QNL45_06800, partial [Nitrospirota bacterium]|nr:hypothetical protein [Nitrospirota bacterium]
MAKIVDRCPYQGARKQVSEPPILVLRTMMAILLELMFLVSPAILTQWHKGLSTGSPPILYT